QKPRYVEIFNRGTSSFQFRIESSAPWLEVTPAEGSVARDERVWVKVNWTAVPPGATQASIIVTGPDSRRITISVPILNPVSPKREEVTGFVENEGYVSIEAEHYTGKTEGKEVRWLKLPDFGRTLSAMTTLPVTAVAQTMAASHSHLDYRV